MSLDPNLEADPTAGDSAGSQEIDQSTQGQPAVRTYTDADMAGFRRSQQAEWDRREQRLRSEFEERYAPRAPQPVPTDPWSQFDPNVAQAMRAAFEHEWNTRSAPIKEQQEDQALANDELRMTSQYPDYQDRRLDILEFAVANNIVNLEQAYRAWKYDELAGVDTQAIAKKAVADYVRKAAARSAGTPSVEGRGGGSPSSKQTFKNREEMDQAAEAMVRQANENSA